MSTACFVDESCASAGWAPRLADNLAFGASVEHNGRKLEDAVYIQPSLVCLGLAGAVPAAADADRAGGISETHSGEVLAWFGVFDGHGGGEVAEFARQNLHRHFVASLQEHAAATWRSRECTLRAPGGASATGGGGEGASDGASAGSSPEASRSASEDAGERGAPAAARGPRGGCGDGPGEAGDADVPAADAAGCGGGRPGAAGDAGDASLDSPFKSPRSAASSEMAGRPWGAAADPAGTSVADASATELSSSWPPSPSASGRSRRGSHVSNSSADGGGAAEAGSALEGGASGGGAAAGGGRGAPPPPGWGGEAVARALRSAFMKTDLDLLGTEVGEFVGAAALAAVVGRREVHLAHCGDAKAVLCRRGAAVAVTRDHRPGRRDEAARVKASGGRVVFRDGAQRVMGLLAVSRALGDHFLRPYVVADPEVTTFRRSGDDEMLLLATDGLWDYLCPQDAVSLALRAAHHAAQRGASRAAACRAASRVLARAAAQRGSRDNITVVVVDLQRSEDDVVALDGGGRAAASECAKGPSTPFRCSLSAILAAQCSEEPAPELPGPQSSGSGSGGSGGSGGSAEDRRRRRLGSAGMRGSMGSSAANWLTSLFFGGLSRRLGGGWGFGGGGSTSSSDSGGCAFCAAGDRAGVPGAASAAAGGTRRTAMLRRASAVTPVGMRIASWGRGWQGIGVGGGGGGCGDAAPAGRPSLPLNLADGSAAGCPAGGAAGCGAGCCARRGAAADAGPAPCIRRRLSFSSVELGHVLLHTAVDFGTPGQR